MKQHLARRSLSGARCQVTAFMRTRAFSSGWRFPARQKLDANASFQVVLSVAPKRRGRLLVRFLHSKSRSWQPATRAAAFRIAISMARCCQSRRYDALLKPIAHMGGQRVVGMLAAVRFDSVTRVKLARCSTVKMARSRCQNRSNRGG